jgi:uncharacterized protein
MSDRGVERRGFAECRIEADDSGRKLRGYAIVFDSLSQDLGGFQEIIAPSAVDRALNEAHDIRALVDHDSAKIVGRTRAGTLSLKKDSRGLKVAIDPDHEISYVKDILRAVSRGDVSGMSFGFRTLDDEWDFDRKVPLRTVTDMLISEVSIVTFPAYTATDVSIAQRSMNAFRQAHPTKPKSYYDMRLRLAR